MATSWIVSAPVVYPTLEVLHVVGIAVLVGNLFLFELRVFGLGRELPVEALGRLSLRLAAAGFALAATTGAIMFAGHPTELIDNRAFVVKMGLLTLAGANARALPCPRRPCPARRRRPRPDRAVAGAMVRRHHLRSLDRLRLTTVHRRDGQRRPSRP